RGLGHTSATRYLKAAGGKDGMNVPPAVVDEDSELGRRYIAAMQLAGRYAYAGREWVVERVRQIIGGSVTETVHNHHNYAWIEEHDGEQLVVIRKGATPLAPGQLGFIGGSMADMSAIVRGLDSEEARASLNSTVHGAGRIMSRRAALGKRNKETGQLEGGRVTPEQMRDAVHAYGVELRGAGVDESPFVYRALRDVLNAHSETLEILHELRPIGVAMAGGDVRDPYKD
ncbi:MAG TPA: RtcB family protein, partial [Symbiobacteriaceae bacterium]|nr:RtcB family protein [Symbiobacteriaceae bacterium]